MNPSNKALSAAITWLRFPLIFMVIMLHGASVVPVPGNHDVFYKVIYPLFLWLGETGVPGFLFISGYLFFFSRKGYREKLTNRYHSLFIPYVLWNGLLLVAYLVAYALGYPQDINGKNIADFNVLDYLRLFWDRGTYNDGNFVPLLCPYWYIRNLLILSLLSPVVYFMVKYLRELFLFAVAIWWMLTFHNAFIQQSILFFSLGAYFSIHQIDPLSLFVNYKSLFVSLFVIFGMADIITHTMLSTPVNLQIHRLALICNIPFFFLIANYYVSRHIQSSLLARSAFIIFSIHYLIIVPMRKACVGHFSDANDAIQVILYFGSILTTTALCLLFFLVLPTKFRELLSGNRS